MTFYIDFANKKMFSRIAISVLALSSLGCNNKKEEKSPQKQLKKAMKKFQLKASDIQLRTLLTEQGWWAQTMKCFVISLKSHAICKTFDNTEKYREELEGGLKVSMVNSDLFVKFLGYSPESETVAYELAKGDSVRQFALKNKDFQPRNLVALKVLLDLGKAILALNRAGLVHQDIKPDNVVALIEKNKTTGLFEYKGLKVIDFGIVKEKSSKDLDGGSRAFVPIQKKSPNKDFFSVVMVFAFMLNYLRVSKENSWKFDHKFPGQRMNPEDYKDDTYKEDIKVLEEDWVHIDEVAWVYWTEAKANAAVLDAVAINDTHALFKKLFRATYAKGCEADEFGKLLQEVRGLIEKLEKEGNASAGGSK